MFFDALHLQIAFHFKIDSEIVAELIFFAQPPPELFAHRFVAHVRDVPYHSRHGKAIAPGAADS